jgi:hypothetical protein
MNSQELRALQEAYSQVYELDEVWTNSKSTTKQWVTLEGTLLQI